MVEATCWAVRPVSYMNSRPLLPLSRRLMVAGSNILRCRKHQSSTSTRTLQTYTPLRKSVEDTSAHLIRIQTDPIWRWILWFRRSMMVWEVHWIPQQFWYGNIMLTTNKIDNVQIWCDFDRASSLICGNKMPTWCNRGFYCRSYCLLNMFRAPLYPSSGAQEYYTVVTACCISCCGFQVAGLVRAEGYVSGLQDAAASCKPDT